MPRLCALARTAGVALLLPLLCTPQSFAWGHDAHSFINKLAGENLPADVPAFLRSYGALEALYFYGPQPDHWRSEDRDLYNTLVPEHDIDIEWADLAGPLPRTRYAYIAALAAAQARHPELKLTPDKVGLLPYSTQEMYTMLKSAFRDYRFALANKQDTRPVEAEIVFLAGWLGHYVADGSQPLHTTIHYNGWTGPDPNGYTTDKTIHARFEGDYVHNNIKIDDIAPLLTDKPVVLNDVFANFLTFVRHSNSLVEKVYQLDKTGAFTGPGTPEGKLFTEQCIAAGATELRDMIYTAWIKSADPISSYKGN
ncbi:MAG TPA: nuclease [Acidobacteriaceae bacterium]